MIQAVLCQYTHLSEVGYLIDGKVGARILMSDIPQKISDTAAQQFYSAAHVQAKDYLGNEKQSLARFNKKRAESRPGALLRLGAHFGIGCCNETLDC